MHDPREKVTMRWDPVSGVVTFSCVRCGRRWRPTKERLGGKPLSIHRDSFECYECERQLKLVAEAG